MKWTCTRGRLANQFRINGVLWVPELSMIRCTSGAAGPPRLRVEELPELDRAMPLWNCVILAGLHVEGRKQRGRPMPPVVVRATLDLARAHRQHRLRAVQRLNLGLLVDTKHDARVGGCM